MTQQKRLAMDYDDIFHFFKIENGNVVCKVKANRKNPGDILGVVNYEGYKKIRHNGKYLFAHRIVYLLTHGYCPEVIDHINGDKGDNRPENLRAVNFKENRYNSLTPSNNTSGVKGIHQLKDGYGFQASIKYNGKRKFLGTFKLLEEAQEFLDLAREMVHGKFANSGVHV